MGKLNYRKDKHLDFLSNIDNKSLDTLVNIITKDEDGDLRQAEDLTLQDKYNQYKPDHSKYWDLIAADYQYFGGDAIMNKYRGCGVEYMEILEDVCGRLQVEYKGKLLDIIEKKLLRKVVEDSIEFLDNEQRKNVSLQLKMNISNFEVDTVLNELQNINTADIARFIRKDFEKITYNINSKFRSDHLGAGVLMGLGGPIGGAIGGMYLAALSTFGPGYRVTVPATIYISALRQVELNQQAFELQCPSCGMTIVSNEIKYCPNCGVAL